MTAANMQDPAPKLDNIPPEILTHIAFHLAIGSIDDARPAHLLSLLLVDRHINDVLCFKNNTALYSRLFEVNFDIQAVGRREGKEAVTARALAAEFKKRVTMLKHMRNCIRLQDLKLMQLEDIWTVYMMLIENDGKNIGHLIDRTQRRTSITEDAREPKTTGMLTQWMILHRAAALDSALEAGMPSGSTETSLLIWMAWLLTSRNYSNSFQTEEVSEETASSESSGGLEEFLFILRPYVFAAGQFQIVYAPWTIGKLPRLPSEALVAKDSAGPSYLDELTTASRAMSIEHYGRTVEISPPVLSHAAILCFFSRIDRTLNAPFIELPQSVLGDNQPAGEARVLMFGSRTSARYMKFTTVEDSTVHDHDYKRLRRCLDPTISSGLAIEDFYGKIAGCWEGHFSFFDFDAYRNMLSGEARALYEGQFGEQAQVWKVLEVYVRPKANVTRSSKPYLPGSALNAGFDPSTSAFDQIKSLLPGEGKGCTASEMTNGIIHLLENNPTKEHIVAMLGGLEGFEVVEDEEVAQIIRRRAEGDENGKLSTEGSDLEVMLLGTGHSAWGEFLLRGRLRLWDGMASLVKEYSPDGRGRWIYRGYVVSGGNFVGRWRDCVTPEQYVGYEGTFSLSKRVDE